MDDEDTLNPDVSGELDIEAMREQAREAQFEEKLTKKYGKPPGQRYIMIDGVKCHAKSKLPVGRPKGTKNRQTNLRAALTPLAFMRRIYQDTSKPDKERFKAAYAALQYEHPKLQAVAQLNVNANRADTKEDIDAALLDAGIEPRVLEGLLDGTLTRQEAIEGETD